MKKQGMGSLVAGWVRYPFVLGNDVAGEVVEVGPGVTRFKIGDRVLGHAICIDKLSNRLCEGAFQRYVVFRENLACQIPDSLSYEKAIVLPLLLSTAACGLFMKDRLALRYPTLRCKRISNGETVLIWGGSTCVGTCAIQLAVAAGNEVITTASPKNFDYVTNLGASQVFNYRDPAVVQQINRAFRWKKSVGALAIADCSFEACITIVSEVEGRKFVSQASLPQPSSIPRDSMQTLRFVGKYLWFTLNTCVRCRAHGVSSKFIWGTDVVSNDVGAATYERYMPLALKGEEIQVVPPLQVVGEGL